MAKSVPSDKQLSLTGRYLVLIEICLAMLACFTILRIAMLISFNESATPSAGEWVAVLWTGLRFDLLVTLSTAFPQLVFLSAIRTPRRMSRFLRICLEAQWIGGYMALLTVLVSE